MRGQDTHAISIDRDVVVAATPSPRHRKGAFRRGRRWGGMRGQDARAISIDRDVVVAAAPSFPSRKGAVRQGRR